MPVFVRLPYDTDRFPFARLAARVLGVGTLEELGSRSLAAKRSRDPSTVLAASDNLHLRARLAGLLETHPLIALYRQLVREVVAPSFGGWISVTQRPTFRVHLPGTPGVSRWHRDADVTGRLDYINAWVPFIDAAGTTALHVESEYDSEEYLPVDVPYGQVLVFDGGLLSHGSVTNTTDRSRVSLDFRFTPWTDDGGQLPTSVLAARPAPPYHLTRPVVAPPHRPGGRPARPVAPVAP